MTQNTISIDQALALAKSHATSGELEKARQLYSMVLANAPQNMKAKRGLKAIQKKTGKQPRTSLSQNQINHLNTLYSSGKLQEALNEAQYLCQTNPNVPFLHNVIGALHMNLGQPAIAVSSYKRALEIKSDYVEAHYNLGVAYSKLGQSNAATSCYKRALEIKPDYIEAHNNLAGILNDSGQAEAAIKHCNLALEIDPDCANALVNLGKALSDLGQQHESIKCYRHALEINPDFADAHNNLGISLSNLGRLDAAIESYERAIECKPDFATAHNNLSKLKKYKPNDTQIMQMESLLAGQPQPDEFDRMHLCFALGKAYEDIKEYNKSFEYLSEANRLRKKGLGYDISTDIHFFSRIKKIFSVGITPCDITHFDNNSAIKPVFIVGMPRSGTSLVEQILASHSRVFGAGEMRTMDKLVGPMLAAIPDATIDDQHNPLPRDTIEAIRSAYLESLNKLNVPEKIITDKMPLNFRWIGFILSAFPEAKIINLSRDPIATCWSIYKFYFATKGNAYAYDLEDLAAYYKLYVELMSFWRDHFPHKIYDICYEALTENQEEETRKLLEYCDLDWEDQCLDFHETNRTVKTASSAQVRQKIYKGSSEAWKNYETHLQPLIKSLADQV